MIHIKKVALTQINLYYKIKNPISYMHKYLDTIFRGKFLKWNNEGRGERILGLFVKSLVEGSFKFDLPNGSLVSLPIGYSHYNFCLLAIYYALNGARKPN